MTLRYTLVRVVLREHSLYTLRSTARSATECVLECDIVYARGSERHEGHLGN